MMYPVDLDLLREKPELFKEAFIKRGLDPTPVDEALKLDRRRVELQKKVDELRHKRNLIAKVFPIFNKNPEEAKKKLDEIGIKANNIEELRKKAKEIDEEIKRLEEEYKKINEELIKILWNFPNFVAPEVPVGDENKNTPIKFWGIPRVYKEHLGLFKDQTERFGYRIVEIKELDEKYIIDKTLLKDLELVLKGEVEYTEINFNDVLDFEKLNKDKIVPYVLIDWEPKHHYDLIKEFGIADTDKAGEVAGSRFYFEFNELVLMDLGLAIEGVKFLIERGYKPVIPPYLLKEEVMRGVIFFEEFQDTMYKIENEDLYLIATAEHSLTALYYNEIIDEDKLPIKLAGWSPCFRKEAGAHGKDTKGIFRVHVFHKVEQYIFCKPEDSEKYHQELIKNAEEFMQKLNIPYRVVLIASQDMGKRNYKQYDIEGWFPGQGKYRELVSGSNVTDWQARRCNIRLRRKDNRLEYVHTLNCTLVAHQRTLCCVLENFYSKFENCIYIPRILQQYVGKLYMYPKS